MRRAEEFAFLSPNDSVGGKLAFAHRGGASLWPENTLKAFEGATALGCRYLETDLRMTADGEIVILHDADLSRTTDGQGLVSQCTLEELQRFDAGYHFTPDGRHYPERGRGHRVPTLQELVEALPQARFNVEIKEWGPPGHDLPARLWDFLSDRGLSDRFLVAAERHELAVSFRKLCGGRVPTSASRRECLAFWLASVVGAAGRLPWSFQALQIPTSASGLRIVTPSLLRAAHRRGIQVHVWTIDEESEMEDLLQLGVDGLMSDRPDRLLRVLPLEEVQRMPGAEL